MVACFFVVVGHKIANYRSSKYLSLCCMYFLYCWTVEIAISFRIFNSSDKIFLPIDDGHENYCSTLNFASNLRLFSVVQATVVACVMFLSKYSLVTSCFTLSIVVNLLA